MSSPTKTTAAAAAPLTSYRVMRLFWPLAASWLLMGMEMPLYTAVVARLPEEKASLAAFSALVFPLALLIEAPIIMLLAASTALSRDLASYRKLWRFTHVTGAALTVLHALLAFTPLYYLVAVRLMDVPEEVVEPARLGLQIMTPWTWAIASRRFQQGLLIRFERSSLVGLGTLVRFSANISVVSLGLWHGGIPGVVVGTAGISVGVLAEALFASLCVRPIVRGPLAEAPPAEPLTRASFAAFYVPLAMTPFITLFIHPVAAAAMNRMPRALDSHAAWTALWGLVFLTRSVGFAYNEVVVRLLDEPGSRPVLARFGRRLGAITMAVLALVAATPLADFWFETVSDLDPELAGLCKVGIVMALLMPGYAALQSWYQGVLVHAKRTSSITMAVALYALIAAPLLWLGVLLQSVIGIYYTLCTLSIAGVSQTIFLAWRTRPLLRDAGAEVCSPHAR